MKMGYALLAASFLAFIAPAYAGTDVPAPDSAGPTYASVKDCLEKVCIQYKGAAHCLKEGTHFRSSKASPGPDSFRTEVAETRPMLRTHPLWAPKWGEVKSCMGTMTLTGR